MRSRADQLVKERAAGTSQVKTSTTPAPKAKKAHHAKKKVSPHDVKKTDPKS